MNHATRRTFKTRCARLMMLCLIIMSSGYLTALGFNILCSIDSRYLYTIRYERELIGNSYYTNSCSIFRSPTSDRIWIFPHVLETAGRFESYSLLSYTEREDAQGRDDIPGWFDVSSILNREPEVVLAHATGWPCRAFACAAVYQLQKGEDPIFSVENIARVRSSLQGGFWLQPTQGVWEVIGYRLIPLRPLFPGLVINALLYGGIWYCLYALFCAVRRRRRLARAACPLCGYDCRASDGKYCPECGWGREKDTEQSPIKS
jgi:hypothetical protein